MNSVIHPTADAGGFLGVDHARNERRTWIVTGLCGVSLAVQVAGGVLFHSMALTASGLHMAASCPAVISRGCGSYAY